MADRIMKALGDVLSEGQIRTRDLGGTREHHRITPSAICRRLAGVTGWYSRVVPMLDEITEAVLSREEIARYLEGSHGESGRAARERIEGYLEELRTTQRYSIYRALKHPLYPILRKIERIGEHIERVQGGDARRAASSTRRTTEPHRLPGRAAGARRQRHPPADHRRRHQPVRRAARPAAPPRHRRDPDPAQHQGPGLPDHAEGVRRRAAAQARLLLLSGRRPQLQRRDEDARRPG